MYLLNADACQVSIGYAVNQLTDCHQSYDPAIYACMSWTEMEIAAFIQALDGVHNLLVIMNKWLIMHFINYS
jgi:hypothetical protein